MTIFTTFFRYILNSAMLYHVYIYIETTVLFRNPPWMTLMRNSVSCPQAGHSHLAFPGSVFKLKSAFLRTMCNGFIYRFVLPNISKKLFLYFFMSDFTTLFHYAVNVALSFSVLDKNWNHCVFQNYIFDCLDAKHLFYLSIVAVRICAFLESVFNFVVSLFRSGCGDFIPIKCAICFGAYFVFRFRDAFFWQGTCFF